MTKIEGTGLPQAIACPHCRGRLDGVLAGASNRRRRPTNGAVNICIKCAGISIFVVDHDGVGLRLPTPEELLTLRASPQVAEAQAEVIRASRHPVRGWDLGE